MIFKSFTTITAGSTIIENNDGVVKTTPVYPIFNSENSSSFTTAEALPKFIKLDGKEFITYPLKPNMDINLFRLTEPSENTVLTACLDDKIIVKDVVFYIGEYDPFGTSILYTPEFKFERREDRPSMRMYIDEHVESHGPSYVIKGRMKGEADLAFGRIKVWMEDVKVIDESGKDVSNDFHFIGYTVDASIISTKRTNK